MMRLASIGLGLVLVALGCADDRNEDSDLEFDAPRPSGEPVEAPEGAWQWIEFAGTTCRDGSPAGVSVQLRSGSKRVMLYLEGGGSCYDVETCAANSPRVMAHEPGSEGVFDRENPLNPVREWNFIYVPYCSGDWHVGDAGDVAIAGVPGEQQFRGRSNLERFLDRLVPTFEDAEQVLLTGFSAGGVGALLNHAFVQQMFGDVPVTMIDDSGPVMSVDHVPACLNQLRRRAWSLDRTIIGPCGPGCDPDGDFLLQFARRSVRASKLHSGLIHSIHDDVIRSYYGIATNGGKNDCKGVLGGTPMEPRALEAGLVDLRAELMRASSRFGTFFPASSVHGWIGGPDFYTQTAGAEGTLVEWFRAVVEGELAAQLGP